MSLRSCINVVPSLLKRNNWKPFLQSSILCNQRSIVVTHYSVSNTQLRYFFKDITSNERQSANGKERIYYGVLTPQIKAVKWFSLTSSMVGIIAQPFLYKEIANVQSITIIVAAYSILGFFTFVTPFLLHLMTKNYVTHLDYNSCKGTYIASSVNFFCRQKKTEFSPDDVKVPTLPGMFTTFIAKERHFFIDPRLFADPTHYSKIMGYDKPIDYKLFQTSANETKK